MTAGLIAALATGTAAHAEPVSSTRVGSVATIQAEDFKPGKTSYHDSTSRNLGHKYRQTAVDIATGGHGYYVGWTTKGEWLEYGIDVASSATYQATLRVASNQSSARTFSVLVDGRNVTGTVTFSGGTGWNSWHDVRVDLGSLTRGKHTLRVVFGTGSLDFDQMTLSTRTVSTAAASRTTAAYPGQPAKGDVYWGAFYRGSATSTSLTSRYGTAGSSGLETVRSYFNWSQRTTALITTARTEIAAGRVPWVSIKPPSWRSMASGSRDAEIDQLLRALDALPGPVWLTIHHEPEGGGGVNSSDDPAGPAGHLAMNKQVRERMNALGVDNIALAPILMEWTFNSKSGRNPNAYWAAGVYDFLGIDTYSANGASFDDANWQAVRTWAAARGVDVAVGEYGIHGSGSAAANVMREFYEMALDSGSDGRGARVVALTVFDSAPKGWALKGAQLTEFIAILRLQ